MESMLFALKMKLKISNNHYNEINNIFSNLISIYFHGPVTKLNIKSKYYVAYRLIKKTCMLLHVNNQTYNT